MYYNNILETIGNTPLVKLNETVKDLPCLVLGKIETFNPGHSIKDRMALKMLEDAEAEGKIKPGGTIIECTSGNTGMGLALAACVKGYKCIFTTSDKQSKEKIDMLKAFGAEVIVCPTNVTPDDPKSYYSVAEKLSREIPNSHWFNQYDNLSNRKAHYETTGPEIWAQTEGKITHLVVGVGTGGTISGTAQYLKEKNPDIQIWGVDTYGSVFKKYHETGIFDEKEIYPYITEGIGEDILPKNVDFNIIDLFEKVTDKDGALMARKLARKEGIFLGYSAGSALQGLLQLKDRLSAEDVVVVIFHDHGSRYVNKVYNDDWMRDRGFIDEVKTVRELLEAKDKNEFLAMHLHSDVHHTMTVMRSRDISQMPVVDDNDEIVGSITESGLLDHLLSDNGVGPQTKIVEVMSPPFPFVDENISISELGQYINRQTPAVIVKTREKGYKIVTNYDIIRAL